MNRQQLQEAISDLEYLVINHPDQAKAEAYRQELESYREQLRRLDRDGGKRRG